MNEFTKIVITAIISVCAKELITWLVSSVKRKIISVWKKPISKETLNLWTLFYLRMFDDTVGLGLGVWLLVWIVGSPAAVTKGVVLLISFFAIYTTYQFYELVFTVSKYVTYRRLQKSKQISELGDKLA